MIEISYLLPDVGAELLHREHANIADESTDQRVRETVVGQIQHILNHIVAIGVLHQRQRIVGDLAHQLDLL